MICPSCSAQIKEGARFCPFCGTSLVYNIITCGNCGQPLRVNSSFCRKCGSSIKWYTSETTPNNGSSNVVGNYVINSKEGCISEINRIYKYFSKIAYLFDEFDECHKKIFHTRDLILELVSYLIWPFFVFFGGMLTAFIIKLAFSDDPSVVKGCNIAYVVLLVLITIVVALFVVFAIAACKERNDYAQKQAKVAIKLTSYYTEYGFCIIAPEYSNPKIIYQIKQNLKTSKAKTLQDAIEMLYQENNVSEYRAKKYSS